MRALILILLLAGLTACAKNKNANGDVKDLDPFFFPNVDNTIYGAWGKNIPDTGKDGLTKNTNLYFNMHGEMGAEAICEQAGDRLIAGLQYGALITGNRFSVKDTIHMVQKGSGTVKQCELTFDQGDFDYTVSGDNLQIKYGKMMQTFTRIR